jgi:microcystin-dependent protein
MKLTVVLKNKIQEITPSPMKKIYALLAGLIITTQLSFAQVGFNNDTPDPSSVLDLTATDKGFLIPRMTAAQRQAIISPAQSLLVYDTTDKHFYFFNGGQWYALNEWDRIAGSNNISYTGSIAVNIATPNASSVLDLTSTDKGLLVPRMTSAQRQAIATPANSLLVFDTGDNKFYYYLNSQWNALNIWNTTPNSTDISYTGNVTINGNLSASNFGGINVNGVVPPGGIIMWSGSIANIPSGWALCNGSNGTPDLRDRFIVGAGGAYSASNTGGSNTVTLVPNQVPLPAHNHTATTTPHSHTDNIFVERGNTWKSGGSASPGNGTGWNQFTGTTSSATVNVTVQSSNDTRTIQAVNIRPLYFALAYIMRL